MVPSRAHPSKDDCGGKEVEITLNERPVSIFGRRHTGLDIKKAAIAQGGIPIGLDFALGMVRPGARTPAPVADSEKVSIAGGSRVVAARDGQS